MADPLNMTGLVGLYSDRQDVCTIEASCVTGFEPMAQEEIKVTVMRVYLLSSVFERSDILEHPGSGTWI